MDSKKNGLAKKILEKKQVLLKTIVLFSVIAFMNFPSEAPGAEAYNENVSSVSNDVIQLEREVWVGDRSSFAGIEKRIIRIIQENPLSSFGHYLLAHLFVRRFAEDPSDLSYLRKASELAQQAIDIDKTSDFGYIVVAEILDVMGQQKNAMKILRSLPNVKKEYSWRYYFIIAKLQSDNLQLSELEDLLEKSLKAKYTQADVVVPYLIALLGAELEGENYTGRLSYWYNKYPNHKILQSKAIALVNQNKYAEAHRVYEQIYTKDLDYKEAMINDAILLYKKLKQPQQSKKILQQVFERFSGKMDKRSETMVYVHLGVLHLRDKNYGKANEFFLQGLLCSDNEKSILTVVLDEYKSDNSAKARSSLASFLDKSIDVRPASSYLYALAGQVKSEYFKDHASSIVSYKSAIILEPNRSDFFSGMGLAYYRMSNMKDALSSFLMASELDPSDSVVKYNIACVYALLGKADEALAALSEAVHLDPKLQQTAKNDRDFDSLRNNNKFSEILADIGNKFLDAEDKAEGPKEGH
jgi:tetratricopeptide (TPR) repeat protein